MKTADSRIARKSGWVSIFGNVLLFVIKYWAGITSQSVAIITDAWHTLSDSLSSIILLVGVKISSKPADKVHPFGHGRAELIAAVIIGVLLAMIAVNFIIEAINKLMDHNTVVYGILAVVVTVISIVAKELMAQYAFWAARKTGSKVLKADGWHHRSDAISSVIILIGIFLGQFFWWLDAFMGIIVAFMLIYATYEIMQEAVSALLGEAPSPELINKVKEIATHNCKRQIEPHQIRIHDYENHAEITFHIVLSGDLLLKEANAIASKIKKEIKQELDMEATIHIDTR